MDQLCGDGFACLFVFRITERVLLGEKEVAEMMKEVTTQKMVVHSNNGVNKSLHILPASFDSYLGYYYLMAD